MSEDGAGSVEAARADAARAEPGHREVDLGEAARRVLAGDGRQFILQPWQIAYCFALVEGREPVVPPGCGVGKGWLDARLREAQSDVSEAAADPS